MDVTRISAPWGAGVALAGQAGTAGTGSAAGNRSVGAAGAGGSPPPRFPVSGRVSGADDRSRAAGVRVAGSGPADGVPAAGEAMGPPGGGGVDGGQEEEASFADRRPDGTPLSDAELREVALLKKIDAKVRAHELAHLAAAGAYARGGASFQYKRGPDGRNYAVGGEVPIDTSKEASPEETIAKMRQVRAAALAPADPSPQDLKVAASATAAIGEAQKELQMLELDARMRAAQRHAGEGERDAAGPAVAPGVRVSQGGVPAIRVRESYQDAAGGSAGAARARPPAFSRVV